jgi:hypothetical protein
MVVILSFIVGGGVLWYLQQEVSFYQLPEVKMLEKREVKNFKECVAKGYPILESYPRQCKTPDGKTFVEEIEEIKQEISFSDLFYMNPGEKRYGIEQIEVIDIGFVETGIYEQKFVYGDREYILTEDLSMQGMQAGTTTYSLQKLKKNGSRENLKNYLGDIERWESNGGTGPIFMQYENNLYLIMSIWKEEGNYSAIIIKNIDKDDIVKDTLISITGNPTKGLRSSGSILIIKNKLYFKLLESCSSQDKHESKVSCDISYYFVDENGKFIKDESFKKEKEEFSLG